MLSLMLVVLLVALAAGFAWLAVRAKVEHFKDQRFLHLLDADPSALAFFGRMSPTDLAVRGAKSKEQYRQIYLRGASEQQFTVTQQQMLDRWTFNADVHLRASFPGLAELLNRDVPWRFAKVDQATVEAGLPHTLGDTIVLSDRFFGAASGTNDDRAMIITLLHERMHVFQRLHPELTDDLIVGKWGWRRRSLGSQADGLARNNPDLPSWSYEINVAGQWCLTLQQYLPPPGAKTLSDSRPVLLCGPQHITTQATKDVLRLPDYVRQLEHPYEIMACMLPVLVLGQTPKTQAEREAVAWMDEQSLPNHDGLLM